MMSFDEWLKEYNKLHNTKYNREDYQNNESMRTDWQNYRYGITINNGDGTTTTTFGDGSTAIGQIPSNNENYGIPNTGANTMINTDTTSSDVNNAINEYYDRLDAINAQQLAWAKEQAAQQQTNFQTELQLKQQERADTLLENATTRKREDTYYQRMMADLAAAGINPLMAGQLSGAGVKMGMVANGNINTPGAVGLNLSAPQSNAAAVAADIASKRQTQTEQAKVELDYQRLQNDKDTAWATINQGYELFKGNAELQEKLKKYDRQTNEILEGLKTKGQKELQKDAQNFEKSLFDLEYELKERGQWLDFGAKIAAAGLGLVGDIFAFKKFQLPKNFGKGIPNAKEYGGGLPQPGEVLPGPEGTTRSPGGIYY